MRLLLLFLTFVQVLSAGSLEENLKKLVAIASVTSDLEKNHEALLFVKEELKGLPLYFYEETFNGHPTLLITTQDKMTPQVLLAAHIDVVPAEKELFDPRVSEGKLFGRGAYDMKMAIACYVKLLKELKPPLSQYDIGVMLTSDEEVGGKDGVRALLAKGVNSSVVLLPDGGFDWNFEEQAKGVLHLKISAKGVSAHGSRPWEGKNAILPLSSAITLLHEHFEKKQSEGEGFYTETTSKFGFMALRKPRAQTIEKGSVFVIRSPFRSFDRGEFCSCRKKPNFEVVSVYTTLNVGTVRGGEAVNQVAASAEAAVDIRYPPSASCEAIFQEVSKLLSGFPGIQVEKIASASPSSVDANLPYFRRFAQIAERRYGIRVGKTRSHGASDARYFGEKGIPVLVIAPKGGSIHSEGEWVDLDDLERFYEVMKEWVIDLTLEDEGR